jgi:hypothetical protein
MQFEGKVVKDLIVDLCVWLISMEVSTKVVIVIICCYVSPVFHVKGCLPPSELVIWINTKQLCRSDLKHTVWQVLVDSCLFYCIPYILTIMWCKGDLFLDHEASWTNFSWFCSSKGESRNRKRQREEEWCYHATRGTVLNWLPIYTILMVIFMAPQPLCIVK